MSADPLDQADKKALLVLARETLARFLSTDTLPLVRGLSPRAMRAQGAFVTLKKRGELRGCIGRIVSSAPLAKVVAAMTLEAALNDTRFEKVRASEVSSLEIEISVLTPPRTVAGPAAIVVGRDGVILQKSGRSAVFLPQVATEQGLGPRGDARQPLSERRAAAGMLAERRDTADLPGGRVLGAPV